MKFRGQYIDQSGLKWIVGESENVEIQEEIFTASINGRYVIWSSLEKLLGINENNGEEMWVKFNTH
jgi:hypothetical protein